MFRVDEIARPPGAYTVVEGVRRAIAIATERRRADATLAQRRDALTAGVGDARRILEALDGLARPTLEARAACDTEPRVARIETFHVLQWAALTQFLAHFRAAQATLQGLAITVETCAKRPPPNAPRASRRCRNSTSSAAKASRSQTFWRAASALSTVLISPGSSGARRASRVSTSALWRRRRRR